MAIGIQFEPPDFRPGRDLDKLVEDLGELSGERPQLHLEEAAPEAGGPDVEVVFLWISYGVSTVQAMRYLAKAVGWLRERFRESPLVKVAAIGYWEDHRLVAARRITSPDAEEDDVTELVGRRGIEAVLEPEGE